jgi:hypothetical protein
MNNKKNMSKTLINKKNLFLLCLSLMCAVEKVSAAPGDSQNFEDKTWSNLPQRALKGASDTGQWAWNLPQRALKGASDAGQGVWKNVSSYIWGEQTPVDNLDYTDGELLTAISAMEELGNYRRAPLAKRVEVISNRLGWSDQKAQHLLEEQGLDAEFADGDSTQEDRIRARPNQRYNLRALVPVKYGK